MSDLDLFDVDEPDVVDTPNSPVIPLQCPIERIRISGSGRRSRVLDSSSSESDEVDGEGAMSSCLTTPKRHRSFSESNGLLLEMKDMLSKVYEKMNVH